jgi:hypothetical protein
MILLSAWGSIPWWIKIVGGIFLLLLWPMDSPPTELFRSYERYAAEWNEANPADQGSSEAKTGGGAGGSADVCNRSPDRSRKVT